MTKLITRLRKSKKGFTLVELLVVIAIIGVLMAILIPTVMNFVGDARRTAADSSANNIYNVATAYQAKRIANNEEPYKNGDETTLITKLTDTTDQYVDPNDYDTNGLTIELDSAGKVTKVIVKLKNGETGYYPREARSTSVTSTP